MDPYIGQLMLVPYTFAPANWAFCQGQIMPIQQNAALYSLIGITYGGNGSTNFALPNLQGRVALGTGSNYTLGQNGGQSSVTLSPAQLAGHTHSLVGSSASGTGQLPSGLMFASGGGRGKPLEYYVAQGGAAVMNPGSLSAVGGGGSHPNTMPSPWAELVHLPVRSLPAAPIGF